MIRLLQLLGRAPDFQTERTLETLRRDAGGTFEAATRRIGRGDEYANLFWAVVGLRREVSAFDVVHAWDGRALFAAAWAGAARIVFSPPPAFPGRAVARLRLAMRYRDVQIVCTTSDQRQRFIRQAIPAERCHVVAPPVHVPAAAVTRDAALRRRLGIAEDNFVLLAPGESTRAATHERAAWTGSILHVVDERYKVLLWGRGERLRAAAELGLKLRQPGLVVVAERVLGRAVTFDELLPAADAVLATPRGPVPTLPVALAMAAGVPVISVETTLVAELRPTRRFALTPAADAPRLLAQCVLDLRADPAMRERMIAEGRSAAGEFFAASRATEQYRQLYASLAAGTAVTAPRAVRDAARAPRWEAPNLGGT